MAVPSKQRTTTKKATTKVSGAKSAVDRTSRKVKKELAPSFATGGGGVHFETHIQASFVTLMLTGGYAPGLRTWPIAEIKLQSKITGAETDDLVVTIQRPGGNERRRLLAQVKYSCDLTARSKVFGDVLRAHWVDYSDSKVFARGSDALALITGPLKDIDIVNVHWLLEHARATESPETFLLHVKTAKFRPPKAVEKLAAFRHHLEQANGGAINEETLWDFLRHFHLLSYDLGGEFGVVLPLLHSHMAQFKLEARPYWGRLVTFVSSLNPRSGVITPANVPEDIREAFTLPQPATIPTALTTAYSMSISAGAEKLPPGLAIMLLIGAFDEGNSHDMEAVATVFGLSTEATIACLRSTLDMESQPIVFAKGNWRMTNRKELATTFAAQIFPDQIDRFIEVAKCTLAETSNGLVGDTNDGTISDTGAALRHSHQLRRGVAEGLAIMGNYPDSFIHLPAGRARMQVFRTVAKTLYNVNWQRWATLSGLLPTLAEAAPLVFTDTVEDALDDADGPLGPLLARGRVDLFQSEYLSGLLWALESVAWDSRHLGAACLCLARLAELDELSASTGRPASSLTTILLPWRPQTRASAQGRIGAVLAICREHPTTAFGLLLSLLPARQQVSSGTRKPNWHPNPPADTTDTVTVAEYHTQVSRYAELALELARGDVDRLLQLVQHMSGLAAETIAQLLATLSDLETAVLSDELQLRLWTELSKELAKHRRFPDAAWSLPADALAELDRIIGKFAPPDPMVSLRPLFSNDGYRLLDSGAGDIQQKNERLAQRRVDAVAHLLGNGVTRVIEFAQHVTAPYLVGNALAGCAEKSIDDALFPELIVSDTQALASMASSYAFHRHASVGDGWVDSLNASKWTSQQWGSLLASLPLKRGLWERARNHSKEAWDVYWAKVTVTPFVDENSANEIIAHLLKHQRAIDAVEFLDMQRYQGREPDPTLCLEALEASLGSSTRNIDEYHTLELLKYVQDSGKVDEDVLARLEFALLPLFFLPDSAQPRTLLRKLATDPEFFCEVIRMVYRSDHEPDDAGAEEKVAESKRKIAEHAWRLLDQWRLLPGMDNGMFDGAKFKTWLTAVRASTEASGHLEVALSHVGRVLAHAPIQVDGFWMDTTLAQILDARGSDAIRDGYRTGLFNARGVHWVDPSGNGEFAISRRYTEQSEAAAEAGYIRLAEMLRDLADEYDRMGKRIKEEYQDRMQPPDDNVD